jgi:hypothetical protein
MIPFWLKIPYTPFVAVLAPVRWLDYGPANILRVSDIALLVTAAALLPELVWNPVFSCVWSWVRM